MENNALQFTRFLDIDYPISSLDTTDGEIFTPAYRDAKFHSAQEPWRSIPDLPFN